MVPVKHPRTPAANPNGSGLRLRPSPHPSLICWSAPAFVSINLTSLGLSLGSHTVRSFTACLASDLRLMLTQQGRRSVAGLEAAASFGGLQHKADLIEAPTSSVRTGGQCLGLGHATGRPHALC